MVLNGLDQLWVADITYLHLAEEFGYLAVILDAFSRKVVGWALEAHLQAELALSALVMAITARQPKRGGLIHHSDRGVQYACTEYTEILAAHDIQPSMSLRNTIRTCAFEEQRSSSRNMTWADWPLKQAHRT
jgi:putative transposase